MKSAIDWFVRDLKLELEIHLFARHFARYGNEISFLCGETWFRISVDSEWGYSYWSYEIFTRDDNGLSRTHTVESDRQNPVGIHARRAVQAMLKQIEIYEGLASERDVERKRVVARAEAERMRLGLDLQSTVSVSVSNGDTIKIGGLNEKTMTRILEAISNIVHDS